MTGGSSSLSAPRITAQKPIATEDGDKKLQVPKQVLKKKKKSKTNNN